MSDVKKGSDKCPGCDRKIRNGRCIPCKAIFEGAGRSLSRENKQKRMVRTKGNLSISKKERNEIYKLMPTKQNGNDFLFHKGKKSK